MMYVTFDSSSDYILVSSSSDQINFCMTQDDPSVTLHDLWP